MPTNRPTLALAMIVKNEAHNLPVLFKTIEGCFDEIHITDTGSTDNTVEVAKSLGATVHHFKWINDFAAARNASIAPIKTDYICWFDGDDSLSDSKAFSEWRDNAMGTADYWMAAYNYAVDPKGNPTCTFLRERVFKNNGKFSFKYFVHEGLVPDPGYIPVASYVQSWCVNHRRTGEDLKKDKGRNLNLFNFHADTLDSRMKFYYGKEYYENGDPISAVRWLMEAVATEDLQPHDRLLGLQYLTYSLINTNQIDRAVNVALTGLQLFPMRAELWTAVADCYLKQGRFQEALPFLGAAKNCPFHDQVQTKTALPVFNHKDAYTTYPRNQLAKVYSNIGDFKQAKKEAEECIEKYGSEEAKSILLEVDRVLAIQIAPKTQAQDCDDIVITGHPNGFYEWDWDVYKEKGIGGSETAAVEMAYHFHKLTGRKVKVFNNRTVSKNCDGVDYLPAQEMPKYFSQFKPYAHISWRHNFKLTDADTYVWSHDLITPGLEQGGFKKILALSDFHKKFLKSILGLKEESIRIIRNGINPDRFKELGHPEKKPLVVFRSSPDRGLDRAIAVMDVVRKTLDMEMNVYYGFDNLYKNNMGAYADQLKDKCASRPWIKLKGNVDQKTLSKECSEAMIWLYPTNFAETFCIGAIESLCEGVFPVVRRFGALKDTLAEAHELGMCVMLDHDCETEDQIHKYAEEVIKAVRLKSWEKISVDPENFSWRREAESWLKWIEEDKSNGVSSS